MQMPTQHAGKRKHRRYIFSASLSVIRKVSPNGTRSSPGICGEISESGLSAILTDPLQVGEEVELRFELTPGNAISVTAAVRNQNHFRHGFEFVRISEDKQQKIRNACMALTEYAGGWY
jgi:hypothetical protein